jgi:hypothetical protein
MDITWQCACHCKCVDHKGVCELVNHELSGIHEVRKFSGIA